MNSIPPINRKDKNTEPKSRHPNKNDHSTKRPFQGLTGLLDPVKRPRAELGTDAHFDGKRPGIRPKTSSNGEAAGASKKLSDEIERAQELIEKLRARYFDNNDFFDSYNQNYQPVVDELLLNRDELPGCSGSTPVKDPLPVQNFPGFAEDEHSKIKLNLSRRQSNQSHVGTYVDEEIIKLTYDHQQKELEMTYQDCTEEERDELYRLFDSQEITLKTLISWADLYHEKRRVKCGKIDLRRLYYLKKPLEELDQMVGLTRFKESVVEQILLCLQELHLNSRPDAQEMYHTVIYGPPGVGKTQLAKILGYIYIAMGLIYKRPIDLSQFDIEEYFETASRPDLIGMYCGHTAVQTQKIIDRCRKGGKVLFIDETYSLGEKEGRDNFSKECIDTINKNLTEGAGEFICIIAGYPEDIKKCFFAHNKGLERRFNFRYTIDKYSHREMKEIFLQKLKENGWDVSSAGDINDDFFLKNEEYFPHYGGDIVCFLQKCKIAHAKRVFAHPEKRMRELNDRDIQHALALFKKERAESEEKRRILSMLYT
jgi:hypothetical protein